MASKGTQSNAPRKRAQARTVASSRTTSTSRPKKSQPVVTVEASRRAQLITIGLTLILLAIPCVIAVVRLADAAPSRQAPLLFPPWYSLGAVLAIAIVWVNYVLWLYRKA